MKILFVEPLVAFPTKLHRNGRRSDLGLRWSVAYLCGAIKSQMPHINYDYKPYRLHEFQSEQIDIEKDVQGYDVICIGACTNEMPHALHVASIAKEQGLITIMGGIFPTANPRYILDSGYVDYVILGEAEETLCDLLRCIENNGQREDVSGIAYKDKCIYITQPRSLQDNIDTYKPDLDIFSLNEYRDLNLGNLYSARGCSFGCSFCTVSPHWGKRTRYHSIEYVLSMLELYADIGFERVHLIDEAITANKERALQLFKAIAQKGFPFRIKVKSRLADLDSEIVQALKEAGVYIIQCGLETTSYDRVDFANNKKASKEILNKVSEVTDNGLRMNLIFQLGLRGLDKDDLLYDRDQIIKICKNPAIMTFVGFFTPHPVESESSTFSSEYTVLTGNLNYYDHKRIVAVPNSLGDKLAALHLLHQTYIEIVDELGNEDVNPTFSLDYLLFSNEKMETVRSFQTPWPNHPPVPRPVLARDYNR